MGTVRPKIRVPRRITFAAIALALVAAFVIVAIVGRRDVVRANRKYMVGPPTKDCAAITNAAVFLALQVNQLTGSRPSPKIAVFCDSASWSQQVNAQGQPEKLAATSMTDLSHGAVFFNAPRLRAGSADTDRTMVENYAMLVLGTNNESEAARLVQHWQQQSEALNNAVLLGILVNNSLDENARSSSVLSAVEEEEE